MAPARPLPIATAPRVDAPRWANGTTTWAEVLTWPDDPADHKECGGYVFGVLRADERGTVRRRADTVASRSVLALDADYARPDLLDTLDLVLGWASLVHSTYNSSPEALRLRVLVPLTRDVSPDEYRALADTVMGLLGREQFDRGGRQPERCMYGVSEPEPGALQSWAFDGPWLDPDTLLTGPEPSAEVPTEPGGDDRAYADLSPAEQALADREVESTVDLWRTRLADALDWPEGERDHKERGWEGLAYQWAYVAARLALTPWTRLDEDSAKELHDEVLPPEIAAACPGKWSSHTLAKAAGEPFDPLPSAEFDAVGYEDIPTRLDDAHMAEWMARRGLADTWCWTGGIGWMHWDGRRWVPRADENAREAVRLAVVDLNKRALDARLSTDRMRALHTLLTANRIGAIEKLMRGVVEVPVGEFDQQPDLLNVGNGVVDLRTGELLPHSPDLRLTKITETPYVPDAEHPDWTQALTALDPEVVDWMQVRFGQAATGYLTPDDLMPIGQGGGSNGKSTMLAGLSTALGDHLTHVPEKLLLANPNDHPTELMTLRGARVAVVDETPEAANLNVARLKAILGQETMKARALYKNFVTWQATHSLFVMTNYTPTIRETDHGTWRRLALVRFTRQFPKDDRFRARIVRGRGGIREAVLAWVVAGAGRWYDDDETLPPLPARVEADTRTWREDSDLVLAYLNERIVFDPTACVTSTDLRHDINDWLTFKEHQPWNDRLVASRLGGHEEMQQHNVVKRDERNPEGLVQRYSDAPVTRAIVWRGMRWRTEKDD